MKRFSYFFLLYALCALLYAPNSYAHAFGQQYTLPLPAWLYIYGGAITILLSFILATVFIKPHAKQHTKNISLFTLHFSFFAYIPPRLCTTSYTLLKTLSVALLLLAIVSGFIGINIGALNFNMTYFWIFLIIGGGYLSAFIGNWWKYMNPWKILIDAFENLMHDSFTGIIPYPKHLGYIPSILFCFLLMIFEFIFQTTPFTLSLILFIYTTITLSGMILFGKEDWNTHAEVLTVYFSLLSLLSPFSLEQDRISFHLPGFRTLHSPIKSLGLLTFILILLAGTAFDGFKETTTWFQVYYSILHNLEFLFPISTYQAIEIVFYLVLIISFGGIYAATIWLTRRISKASSSRDLALIYTKTLIPVLLGYNIAHYFPLILTQGQAIISLISDPFGFGWNIFGTVDVKPNISLLSLHTIWHIQVAAIILGHVLAIILSHIIGQNLKRSQKSFSLSQIPLLILMIFYTMGGLWLLSLPLN